MQQFESAGLTFDVIDQGDPDQGTFVLLHGFPQTSRCWRYTSPLLNTAGYRTLAPDLRGYSPGARPHGRRAYRLPELVEDVVALIDESGGKPVHVLGHDWGALIGWSLAALRPDLVRTLTTVSVPHPGAFVRSMLGSDQVARSWYMAAFQVPAATEALALRAPLVFNRVLESAGMDPEQISAVHREIVDADALTAALNWYRAMPFLPMAAMRARIEVPTAHVWGAADTALARRGADLVERYVDAPYELHVLPDVGHWIPEHAPYPLAEIARANAAA
ncbi:alpha/beta fold hydrolase [Gordonia humi]|uniref:Pimeloyl-ACP methyl ester carboxylesterase n=1 Tax=Gordonia humi TaxID=686429 RepID=A0A840EPZ1_9ACTN|nr:alpha/beta fold hydrolase [Gordonia humi]MBB4133762.1 pimeloyl-ACP methyl ester carboxylesterase [Gordonia humi]